MITKINTVTLYVSDQQKARDFYVEYLGFRIRRDEDMGPMGRWLEVAPDGAQTGFMLASAAGFGKQDQIGASADIVLHTDDVAALHQRLTAVGLPGDRAGNPGVGHLHQDHRSRRAGNPGQPAPVRPASGKRHG